MRLAFAAFLAAALFGVPFLSSAVQKQPFLTQHRSQITSFAVGPDQTVTYPNSSSGPNQLAGFPDEHTTFLPPAASGAPYLVFGAASKSVKSGIWGAVVLQTTDLKTFTFAKGYNFPVLTSPVSFSTCSPAYNTEFDENYAAAGSVVQDPTRPAGVLIMLYGSEQHCPGGNYNRPFYGTVGLARSSDNGKTWPGPGRYPILQTSTPQPTVAHKWLGDVIPSGFVDKNKSGDYYLYVAYDHFSSGSRWVRVARAKLTSVSSRSIARRLIGAGELNFEKWYNGSFSQPGIGGLDSAVLHSAPGCAGYQANSEISYNDDLGLYLMIYVCVSGPTGKQVGAWYYSTATSLDLEDWTAPQKIQNSRRQFTAPCPGKTTGQVFDGNYPSTISPGAAPGHTKLTGYIFFMHNTCDLATRQFKYRTFTITSSAPAAPSAPIIKIPPPKA